MKSTRTLLALALTCFVSSAVAQAPVTVDAEFDVFGGRDGKKLWVVQWTEADKKVSVTSGLMWKNYDAGKHGRGYVLESSSHIEMVTPALPPGCALTGARGLLRPGGFQVSGVTLALQGETCGPIAPELQNASEVILRAYNTQGAYGGPGADEMRLVIRP